MHTRSRLELPVLLAAGALALSACSGDGGAATGGGSAQANPEEVAVQLVQDIVGERYDAACGIATMNSDAAPATENPGDLRTCMKRVQGAHDYWIQEGLLDAAKKAEHGPVGTGVLNPKHTAVGFPGLNLGNNKDLLEIPVSLIDGKYYAVVNYLPSPSS